MKTELTQLGNRVDIPKSPYEAVLEKIPIPFSDYLASKMVVQFSCPEFTSLCPVTGQPDFARIYIYFLPDRYLVESKSLKLYLHSFRNHGGFHEDCTGMIFDKLQTTLFPKWLRVVGIWFPRGGIPIDIFLQTGNPPEDIYVPELKIPAFEGR